MQCTCGVRLIRAAFESVLNCFYFDAFLRPGMPFPFTVLHVVLPGSFLARQYEGWVVHKLSVHGSRTHSFPNILAVDSAGLVEIGLAHISDCYLFYT